MKQIKKIKEWEKAHPNYLKDEKLLTIWHDMIHKIMGPADDLTREKNKEIIKKIDAVDSQQLKRVIQMILARGCPTMTTLGPRIDSDQFSKFQASLQI